MNTTIVIMLGAFVGLCALGLSALLVVQEQRRQERVQNRVDAASMPHLRIRRIDTIAIVRQQPQRSRTSLKARLSSLIGLDLERRGQYRVQWWVVVLVALVLARFLSQVLVSFLGPAMWTSFPGMVIAICRYAFNSMMKKRRNTLFNQFPDVLAMIVRSVRAGVPISEAMRVVAREMPMPSHEEFGMVAADLAIGMALPDALQALSDRNGITEFRFFTTALSLQSSTGGRLGETLENLADIVRKRMALRARGHALASEAKTTALILGCLPVLAGGALYFLNPTYVMILFNDPSGRTILSVAVGLLAFGAFVMRTIISSALS